MLEKDADGCFVAGVVSGAETARLVHARTVIGAVGAQERPMPIPGWTLPGVMTAGAAQTLLKASALAPEGPVVIAGMGPLIWLLAAQYARLGVKVEALLDSTPPGSWRRALPLLPGFLFSRYALKGIGLLAEVRRSTRVHRGAAGIAAEGDGRLEAVRFLAGGREHRIKAATLLLHQGVAPQANLAMAAGARHRWSDRRRAFEPERSDSFESSMPGLFLAGDAAGIGGPIARRRRARSRPSPYCGSSGAARTPPPRRAGAPSAAAPSQAARSSTPFGGPRTSRSLPPTMS